MQEKASGVRNQIARLRWFEEHSSAAGAPRYQITGSARPDFNRLKLDIPVKIRPQATFNRGANNCLRKHRRGAIDVDTSAMARAAENPLSALTRLA